MSVTEATIGCVARTKEPTLLADIMARLIVQDAEARGVEPRARLTAQLRLSRRAIEVAQIPIQLAIAHADGAGTGNAWPTQVEYATYWSVTERTAQRQWALFRSVFGGDPYPLAEHIYTRYSASVRNRELSIAFDMPASLLAAA